MLNHLLSKRFFINISLFILSLVLIAGINVPVASCQEGKQTLTQAQALYTAGKYKQAFKTLDKAIKKGVLTDAEQGSAHVLMANCQEQRKKAPEAKYYFKQALEKKIELPETTAAKAASSEYRSLENAEKAYSDRKFDDSKRILETLLQEPLYKLDRIEPLFLLGKVYVNLKDNKNAKNNFWEVLKIDNNYAPDPATMTSEEYDIFNDTKKEFNTFWNKVKRTPGKLVHNKWTYITAGALVGTGVIIYLLVSDGDDDLPKPPDFPR